MNRLAIQRFSSAGSIQLKRGSARNSPISALPGRKTVSTYFSQCVLLTAASVSLFTSPVAAQATNMTVDSTYPGTSVERMEASRERVKSLSPDQLNGNWTEIRKNLLWAAGLKDMQDVAPGKGNTGHCFNDYNHVDATTMIGDMSDNENDGSVKGIAIGNQLGDGIRAASDPDLGPGGTWCTCMLGSGQDPPQDVAHVQFQSRIAFKLVWAPGPDDDFKNFTLVDDEGNLLAKGKATSDLPSRSQRERNYEEVEGSKYGAPAEAL